MEKTLKTVYRQCLSLVNSLVVGHDVTEESGS